MCVCVENRVFFPTIHVTWYFIHHVYDPVLGKFSPVCVKKRWRKGVAEHAAAVQHERFCTNCTFRYLILYCIINTMCTISNIKIN